MLSMPNHWNRVYTTSWSSKFDMENIVVVFRGREADVGHRERVGQLDEADVEMANTFGKTFSLREIMTRGY